MRSQAIPQCRLKQMRSGVITGNARTSVSVNLSVSRIANFRLTLDHFAHMHDQSADWTLGILNLDGPAVTADRSRITDLTTRLDIEHRLAQYNLDFFACNRALDRLTFAENCQHVVINCCVVVWVVFNAFVAQLLARFKLC